MFLFVFPGQGSQYSGMGKQLFETFHCARAVFQEVDDTLNQHLTKLIFDGPEAQLNLTENTQPAIMAVSMAVIRVLEKEGGFNLGQRVRYVAGHSLGEYSALTAACALTLKDTARLLRLRGMAMQRAVPVGQGTMAALLGLNPETVHLICLQAALKEICEIANDNCEGQTVISGNNAAVLRALEIAKDRGAKKCVPLTVSAPFHCTLMAAAAKEVETALALTEMRVPLMPILTNISAMPQTDPIRLKHHLVQQVTATVRWRETITDVDLENISAIVEIGPGTVLTNLVKRIRPEIDRLSLGTPAEIMCFLENL